jgi:hypothetical protein
MTNFPSSLITLTNSLFHFLLSHIHTISTMLPSPSLWCLPPHIFRSLHFMTHKISFILAHNWVLLPFQPLLFLGMNDDKSLVTVERSWLSIMESLPPTLHRKRYGTWPSILARYCANYGRSGTLEDRSL